MKFRANDHEVTVNIDGGFRAGYVAGLIAHGAQPADVE